MPACLHAQRDVASHRATGGRRDFVLSAGPHGLARVFLDDLFSPQMWANPQVSSPLVVPRLQLHVDKTTKTTQHVVVEERGLLP